MNRQRINQVLALRTNSAYNESKENITIRDNEIAAINKHFDGLIETIMDPYKHARQMEKVRTDPLLSAGARGLDRLKWNLEEGIDVFGRNNTDV